MTMVRIGALVVDLDQCALFEGQYIDGGPEIRVHYLSERFSFSRKSDPAEYRALKAYMEKQMPIDIFNLQCIRDENFNPFVDEMTSTLFSVFSSLPGAEDMVFSLLSDGEGGIWRANETNQRCENALVRWQSLDDALDKLMEFKKQLAE